MANQSNRTAAQVTEAFGRRISSFGARDVRVASAGYLRGDLYPRSTGEELFKELTEGEQDALLGKDVADAVRSGQVSLEQLVVKVPMETEPDFITQASGRELGLD